MTNVITNPISNVPVNPKSHVHGWAQLWKQQLNAGIDHKCTPNIIQFDNVYIDHGANFGGTLNLFGGATKEVYDRLNRVAACKNVISLDWDMPDFGSMLKKRIGAKTTYQGITEDWCGKLSKRFESVKSLKQEDLPFDDVTLGDSHTIAFSGHNHCVLRNDGKTLHGALKSGLKSMLRGKEVKGKIHLCFGSIDIRHHILRHDNFDLTAMIQEYVKQGNELGDAWYCAPVPVEFEGRRIPKSGFYKKTAFYGSQQERRDLTMRFIDELNKQTGGKVIQPPEEWYTMDGEKYANTFMEHGSSFHIAPPYYYRNDWGQTCLQ
jgi:hypothetical protein